MITEDINELEPNETSDSGNGVAAAAKGVVSASGKSISRLHKRYNVARRGPALDKHIPHDINNNVDTSPFSWKADNNPHTHLIDTANIDNPYRQDITHFKPMHSSVDMMLFDGTVSMERTRTLRHSNTSQLTMMDIPAKGKKRDSGAKVANCDLASKPGTVSVDTPVSKVTVDRGKPIPNILSGTKKSAPFSIGNNFDLSQDGDISSEAFTGISNLSRVIVKGIKFIRDIAKKEIIKNVVSFLLPVILIVFILCVLISVIGGAVIAPISALNLTAYPSDEEDITESTYDATNYCEDLKEYIENIPEDPNWAHIDEFMFIPSLGGILSEIDYDGWELQAYLNAKFEKFNSADVSAEIQSVMDEMFVLTLTEIVETRYRINEDGEEESYEYFILKIGLKKTELETVVTKRLDDKQKIMYDLYMTDDLYGTQQGICNPFDFDWRTAVTCHYGYRYIDGEEDFHTGMDLSWGGCAGTPIYAGVTGTVTSITSSFPYGNKVDITSSDGTVMVRYAHMADGSVGVSIGQAVKAGITKIGGVGNTGWSTGPHLHIEVYKKNTRLDPRYVLSYGKRGSN